MSEAEKPEAPAEPKKRKASKALKKRLSTPVPTANAKIIRDLMVSSKVKGTFKDFVIMADNRIIDWRGSYNMLHPENGAPVSVKGLVLIHKSKLRNVIGAELAKQFWHPVLGRRSPAVQPKRDPA